MSKKGFDPQECISALNSLKRSLQWKDEPFSKDTLIKGLKSCGLPANCNFWHAFRNSGIIEKIGKDQYTFVNNDPIYVGKLETVKEKYRELCHRYNKKVDKVEEVHPVVHVDDVQAAIDLLKNNGYRILSPIGMLYKEL